MVDGVGVCIVLVGLVLVLVSVSKDVESPLKDGWWKDVQIWIPGERDWWFGFVLLLPRIVGFLGRVRLCCRVVPWLRLVDEDKCWWNLVL